MRRDKAPRTARFVVACGILAVLAGCGGAKQGQSTESIVSATGPAKSKFIKQADKICLHSDRRQLELHGAYLTKHPNGEESKAGQVTAIKVAILPPMSEEIAALRKLPLPAKDGEEVKNLFGELETGVKEIEADPKGVVEGNWPLRKAEKGLKKFGFGACAQPG